MLHRKDLLKKPDAMIENKWKRWSLLALIIVCGIVFLPVLLVASLALLSPRVRQKLNKAIEHAHAAS